jgi:peptidyl-prolyl cis-trans isomerase-like protein 2
VEEVIIRNPKKKGYVRLHTTHGDVNIELHCDLAPRTCENFITLCVAEYYDGVSFHRSIKNFMVQGGDPTGTGSGGQCIWGEKFKDEICDKLQHTGRGVVSMANSGPGTNGSQFFILYKSARHLDGKHSVFGTVVGRARQTASTASTASTAATASTIPKLSQLPQPTQLHQLSQPP